MTQSTPNPTITSVQASSNHSTESELDVYPWPPKPPDMIALEASTLYEPQPFAVSNMQLYRFKDGQKVLKANGTQFEFDMMVAARDCSIRPLWRNFVKHKTDGVFMSGYVMEMGTPLETALLRDDSSPVYNKISLMNQMISLIHSLHNNGIIHGDIKPANMLICSDGKLRLCDFAEARRMDDDLHSWDGETTVNYMSPHRCRNWPDGRDPPPTVEDDLYGLGLSIWEMFVGEVPFKDVYMDDILDTAKKGETVDISRVGDDEGVKETVRKFLRCGGARV
ncbi:hypothetical protein FQN54_008110 [Arachnomyces sp. PD_36]|nr:hypothetical protein FQN54_008110 [Arachnomyces sp. PD_36]